MCVKSSEHSFLIIYSPKFVFYYYKCKRCFFFPFSIGLSLCLHALSITFSASFRRTLSLLPRILIISDKILQDSTPCSRTYIKYQLGRLFFVSNEIFQFRNPLLGFWKILTFLIWPDYCLNSQSPYNAEFYVPADYIYHQVESGTDPASFINCNSTHNHTYSHIYTIEAMIQLLLLYIIRIKYA